MHRKKVMKLDKLRLEKLKALSDETRLEIVGLLRHGDELCGCDFEKMLDKSQSTISRHLKKLELANIVESRKEGVKVMYKIRDLHIFKLLAVLDHVIKREEKYKKILQIQEEL
ncbi:MAG: ArsR/SmtB family transcription factor [Promethearchaeota archaeon]